MIKFVVILHSNNFSQMDKKRYELFRNNPIELAIIQLRYKAISDFPSEKIKKMGIEYLPELPITEEKILIKIDSTSKMEDTKLILDKGNVHAVRFKTKDETIALTVGANNFFYEIKDAYPGWEELHNRFEKYWQIFKELLNLEYLDGISLRYINKFKLPDDLIDISEYFNTHVETKDSISINDFHIRYSSSDNNIVTRVGHTLEPFNGEKYPYIFDIDIIYSHKMENDDALIWSVFEELHYKIIDTFIASTTEKTKDLIR